MDEKELVYKLKEFSALEAYQVKLYQSQLQALEDPHIKHVYERFVIREQEHRDFIAQQLESLGVGINIASPSFTLAGIVSGKTLDLLSLKDRYKLGIAVEHKAVQMYHEFFEMTRHDPELSELSKKLAYFMVDEEQHEFWFKEHLTRLEHV